MRADREPRDPRAYRVDSLGPVKLTRSLVLVVSAVAFALPGCGDEVDDAADDVQNQLEEAGRDLQKQGRELREDIKDGASEQEIRKRLDDLEQEAREEGQAAEKDFQDVESELP